MKLITAILFLFFLFLESSLTSMPLVFLILLCIAIIERKEWVFLVAFVAGVVLDILTFRTVGETSLFFTVFIFLVFLYERKFETGTKPFVFISSLIGSFVFLLIFYPGKFIVFESIINAAIGILLFTFLSRINLQKSNDKILLT